MFPFQARRIGRFIDTVADANCDSGPNHVARSPTFTEENRRSWEETKSETDECVDVRQL